MRLYRIMKLSPLPVLHCLPSSFSLSPVGHTQEYPVGFGRHKWLQPPLFSWHLSIFSRPSIKIHLPYLIRRILLTDTGEQFRFTTFVPSKPRHIFLKQSFSTWYCILKIILNSEFLPIPKRNLFYPVLNLPKRNWSLLKYIEKKDLCHLYAVKGANKSPKTRANISL